MPQAIVYCDRCGKIISPGDITRGHALVGDEGGVCPSCAALLTPEQRDALRMKLTGEMPVARPPTERREAARPSTRSVPPAGATRRMTPRVTTARQPPPEPEAGGGLQKHIATIGVIAGVSVGVAIALFVASRGKKPDTQPTPRPGPDAPISTPTTLPENTPAVRAAAVARKNLSEIKVWSEDLAGRYHDIMLALKQLSSRFPGTPEAAEARILIQTYEARHAALADAELAKAVEEAKARVDAGRAIEAAGLFDDIRVRFSGTVWFDARGGKALDAAVREVEAAVEAARAAALEVQAKDAVGRAEAMLARDDLNGAKGLLAAKGRWPQPWRGRAEDVLRRIAEKQAMIAAEAEKVRRRKEAWRRFIVDMNARGGEGLKGLEAFLQESKPSLRDLGKVRELSRFTRLLRQARNVEELAEIGFSGVRRPIRLRWKDKTVAGRILGVKDGVLRVKQPGVAKALEVPIGELAPASVVDDAGLKVKPMDAAVYFMMRGDLDGARKRLDTAVGEKASALREEMDVIAALLPPPPRAPAPETVAVDPTRTTETTEIAEITKGLVAWWKLDESTGGNAADSSGRGRDGDVSGAAWQPGGGKRGGSLRFNGRDDYVELPADTHDFSGRFSVSLFARFDNVSGRQCLIGKNKDTRNFAFVLVSENGTLRCKVKQSQQSSSEDHPTRLAAGKWYHIALVMDDLSNATLYVDGIPSKSTQMGNRNNSGSLRIGRPPDRYWGCIEGLVDDFRIYNRALSGEEVAAIAGTAAAAQGGTRYVAGLFAEYFEGRDLDEAKRKATQVVPIVDFNWGSGKPHPDLPQDNFSCRFSGELRVPRDGPYEFFIEVDDEAKLWIGDLEGFPKLEKVRGTGSVTLDLKAGWTPIRMDFVEGSGSAKCRLSWSGPDMPRSHIASEYLRTATAGAVADGYVAGLFAEYFEGRDLDEAKRKATQVVPTVDFDWRSGKPHPYLPRDNFSCRFSGELKVPRDGPYEFFIEVDDKVKLWIGDLEAGPKLTTSERASSLKLELKAGWTPIRMDFVEGDGSARCKLSWSGPDMPRSHIASEYLRTATAGAGAAPPEAARAVEGLFDAPKQALPGGPKQALPGGPKEPLPGETGRPGEIAPGVICEIFKGMSRAERIGVRIDPQISFHFENAPPDLGLQKGTYTLRWTGYFLAHYDGIFTFASENLIVKIDGKRVPRKNILMERGLHKLEAIGMVGPSRKGPVRFRWRPLGARTKPVPSSHLFHEVPELGSMGPFAKVVPGLGAKLYASETPQGRAVESSVEDAEFDIDDLPPCSTLPKEQFSVRLKGYVLARKGGEFIFRLEADDGAQFLVDGDLKIDGWRQMPEDPTAKVQLEAGYNKITILHRDRNAEANLKLLWRPPWGRDRGGKPQFEGISSEHFFREPGKPKLVGRKGLSPGIKCAMYEGDRPGAGRKVFEKLDPHLEHDWSRGGPGPDVPLKNFSAVWKGLLVVPRSGTYLFRARRRGGMRLVVGSTPVINNWNENEAWENGRPVKLRAGTAPIMLAYFNKQDKPAVQVYWSGPNFMLRRLGDGDLVHKAREIKLAAPWSEPVKVVAAVPGKVGPGKVTPGGPAVVPLPVGNLVANGGFEEKDAERKFAARWTKGQWGERGAGYSVRIDMSNPREGGQSALVARALAAGAKAGASASLRLDPGTYRVSYWACANVGATATVGAHFAGNDLPESSVGDEWKQFTHEAQVGAKMLNGPLRVWTSTLNVRVWFDDVEVVMIKRSDPMTD